MSSKSESPQARISLSRRDFVRSVMAAASTPLFSPAVLSACQSSKGAQGAKVNDTLDQAHDLLFASGREHRGSTHVPMVAETLVVLGRLDAVMPWVERNKHDGADNQRPYDFTRRRDLTPKDWRGALGQEDRRADWVAFFERQITESSWQAVVREWTPHLTPGLAAFAAHGIIRTAHAVRSLEASASSQRKRELAEGLGLWAATYQPLPETPAKERGKLKPSEALRLIEAMPPAQIQRGNIVKALTSLDNHPPFANVINHVDASTDASLFLSDLTETFAAVYLANAHDFARWITLVHAVTGTSAARLLLPYVKAEVKPSLLRYGWQLAAGIYAIRGGTLPGKLPDTKPLDKEDLIDRTIKNGTSHPIKFTEACLREYALNPKPVYLQAAQDSLTRIG